jgi:Rps23 Pro-64 3,4-dihydroxylase Tpa1-like proline 4-hydroxylase
MVIHKIREPFPHLVIEDFYNKDELKLIWQELNFLTSPSKLMPANLNGSTEANHLSIILDQVYANRSISDILTVNRKALRKEIKDAFVELNPLLAHINLINLDLTKIKYYENYNGYKKHQDLARFTALTYFYKEPKAFEGGNLYFNDFDYTIKLKNNMLVLFVGALWHESLPVSLKQDGHITGNGKYTMTQFLNINENIQ